MTCSAEGVVGSVLTFFLNSIFLTVSTVVFALDLTSVWPPLVCATIGFLAGVFAGPSTIWLVGFGIAAGGFVGPGILGVFINCWMLGCFLGELFEDSSFGKRAEPNKEIAVLALVLFLVPALCSTLLTFAREFDAAVPNAVMRHGGLDGFWFYVAGSDETWRSALRLIFAYGSSLLLFFVVLRDCESRLRGLLNGITAGAVVCITMVTLQLSGILSEPKLAPYWVKLGVHGGSFSDPAALAVSAILIASMLIPRKNLVSKAAGTGVAIAALWSGSAVVIPGLILLALCGLMGSMKHLPKTAAWGTAALGGGSMIIAGVLLGHPAINRSLRQALPLPAAAATLEAINWGQLGLSLGRRGTYEQVAMSAWRESPIVGIGLEGVDKRYYSALLNTGFEPELVPAGRDNFYMKLLGEEGVFGFALCLFSFGVLLLVFVLRKVRREAETQAGLELEHVSTWCRIALAVFALFLAAQNFLRFEDVRYLAAAALAIAICRPLDVSIRFLRRVRMSALLFFLCFPPFFSFAAARSFLEMKTTGFYPVEVRGEERFAWSVSPAKLQLCGELPDNFRLEFRAAHPDLEARPLKILFYEGDSPVKEDVAAIELRDQAWHSVDVPLPDKAKSGARTASITIRAERLWSPLRYGVSPDARWLGVEIRWPKEAC